MKEGQAVTRLGLERQQKVKELEERNARWRKELLSEKAALKATEGQWKLIKAKLEEIRSLSKSSRSASGMALGSSSSSGQGVPTWYWDKSWKGKARSVLTESQKIADELMDLLEKPRATQEQFRQKIASLRQSRSKEDPAEAETKRKEKAAQVRQELRDLLTTRQEAALMLMGWL
jgi:hypothetical protein